MKKLFRVGVSQSLKFRPPRDKHIDLPIQLISPVGEIYHDGRYVWMNILADDEDDARNQRKLKKKEIIKYLSNLPVNTPESIQNLIDSYLEDSDYQTEEDNHEKSV